MTDKYLHVTYGLGRVYDPELGAWREPITEDEVWAAARVDEALRRSFRSENSDDLQNQS